MTDFFFRLLFPAKFLQIRNAAASIKSLHDMVVALKLENAQLLALKTENAQLLDLRDGLQRHNDSLRKQVREVLSVNHHNAGSHLASEVAFLRLNRETELLRDQNLLLRDEKLKALPAPIEVTPNPTTAQGVEYYRKLDEGDASKPVPALRLPARIDTTLPLDKQVAQLKQPDTLQLPASSK